VGVRKGSSPNVAGQGSTLELEEDVHVTVLDGLATDHEAAVRVWNAASQAKKQPLATVIPPLLLIISQIAEPLDLPSVLATHSQLLSGR
jgi:hypothetical protein